MALADCKNDIHSVYNYNDHNVCDLQLSNHSSENDSSNQHSDGCSNSDFMPNAPLAPFDEDIQVSSPEETASPRLTSPPMEEIKEKLYANMSLSLHTERKKRDELNSPSAKYLLHSASAASTQPANKAFDDTFPSKLLHLSAKNSLRLATERNTWFDNANIYCRAYGSFPKIRLSEISPNCSGFLPRIISYSSSSGKLIANHSDLSTQPEPLLAGDLLSPHTGCDGTNLDDEVVRLLERNKPSCSIQNGLHVDAIIDGLVSSTETMDTGLGSSNTPLSGVSPTSSVSLVEHPSSATLPQSLHYQNLVSTADIHVPSVDVNAIIHVKPDRHSQKRKKNRKNKSKTITEAVKECLSPQVNGLSSSDNSGDTMTVIGSETEQNETLGVLCDEPTEDCSSPAQTITVSLLNTDDTASGGNCMEENHVSSLDVDAVELQGSGFTLVVNKKDKRLQKRLQHPQQRANVHHNISSSSSSCASSTCNGEHYKASTANGHAGRNGITAFSSRAFNPSSHPAVICPSSRVNTRWSQRAVPTSVNATSVTGAAGSWKRLGSVQSPACMMTSSQLQCQTVNSIGNSVPPHQRAVSTVSDSSRTTTISSATGRPANTLKSSPISITDQCTRSTPGELTQQHALRTFLLSRWTFFLKRSTAAH